MSLSRPLRRYHAHLWLTIGALGLCLWASAARAQDAAPSREDMQRSASLFAEAEVAYNEGELQRAVALLEEAHDLYPEPVLLYNLARAHEALGALEEALESYEGYLAASPDTPDRGAIQRRIDSLRVQIAEAEAARNRPPPPPPPTPTAPRSDPASPWILSSAIVSAAAVAALGVGVALAVLSEGQLAEAEAAVNHRDAFPALESAQDLALGANVLFVAAGTLAAAAATGWVIAAVVGGQAEDRGDVALGIGPGSLSLRLRWR